MTEIVIDANVFVHSGNPDNSFFESAVALVASLVDSELHLALDDTGKDSPNEWTSNLYREYQESVPPISFAADVINVFLSTERFVFHPRPDRGNWKICCSLIPRNDNDAILLGIGVVSDDSYIVSNDYQDFPKAVRKEVRKKLRVVVADSDEHVA